MPTIASTEPTVSRDLKPLRAFLGLRRVRFVLSAVVLLGSLSALLGTYEAVLPSMAEQGRAIIPLWRMLAMGAAVMPVVSMHSRLGTLEIVQTRVLRRYERTYLAGMGAISAAVYLAGCSVALHPLVLIIIARSWLAWYGLALIAGLVLGWRQAWTLPALTAVILWFWGHQGGEQYRWWEFSARPHDDVPSLVLSLGLLVVGASAYCVTPWRRRRLAAYCFRRAVAR